MRCPACREENPERAKFCLECGTALAEPQPRASRESRRTVTVVFADMVGFTSLGESLDQESLRRVMDRFYAEMRGAIEAQEGTLAKFIGDAVLAVWGTPEVREDDALRAVRAADAMRLALAGLNDDLHARWGIRVGVRTGVNTGEVVVDPDRPADLLVGDTLNVAARLEQAAGDGEVLVGPETYRLVRDDAVLEPVEPLALKGKAKPMPAWRLVNTVRDDHRETDRLQAPLVGRTAEVNALRAALDTVVTTRSCRMTTVIGSPGLGKTRLVEEFVASVGDEAIVLHGRCQATGEGITFQPVAEVLRGAAGIEDDDGPEEARSKLATVLGEGDPDRDRVIERAASLLGLAPAGSTEETFWAVRRILEGLSRERPLVLVHDDIHWGQPTFLDLLEHFVAWIRDAPVFVLALARPELREVRPGLAEESELIGVIPLQPLDAAASRAMVSGLLGAADLPEGLALRVLETTEGNPLFLGETLRMLADEGVLRREGDSWVAGDLSGVTVPPTINALLAARIQRLDADERSVVERAAVIGHAFYRGAVSELAPVPVRPQVDDALLTLSRKEMVRAEDEWWLDEQVFRFHHVLIRDAAYRSLLKEARAELHERFAGWLEGKAGELAGEHEEVIAFHLEQAHAYQLELGPLDEHGRDLAARAGRRLHSAGCRALAREDLPAAANLLRRALLPLTEDMAPRMEVLVDLAETLVSAGDTGAAEQVVEELGLGADELGDDRLRARAVVFAAQLDNLTGAGQVRDTADLAGAAAETLAAAGDRAGEAKAHQVVAQSEALLGQVAAAEAALDRALVAARAADDRRRITAVLSGAPRAALWGPAPIVRASGRCLDVVRILRMTPGNRHVEAAALRSQAVLEAMRGRADAARGILGTCRVTLEELGLTVELHETEAHTGIVELLAGDHAAAAETHLRAAQEGFHALGIESGAAQAAALLARALLAQDRDEEALEATRFAERYGGEDLKTTAAWLGVRAEVLSGRGDDDQARRLARRAVALTEPTDALADKADALMALAAVEAQAGDHVAAREAATRARELYAAKDHSVGIALAEVLAGAAVPAPGGGPVVRAVDDEAGPAVRALQRLATCLNEEDWDGLHTLFGAEGFRWIDRRSAGFFDEEGRAELDAAATVRSMSTVPKGSSWTFELLADGGDVAAGRMSSRGTGRKAGPWEVVAGIVCVCRGERPVLWEALEDDAAVIRKRYDELRAHGEQEPVAVPTPPPAAGESPAARRWRAYFDAVKRRDFEGMAENFADDFLMIDTRQMGWEPWGRDELVANNRSVAQLDPGFRVTSETLADEGGVYAVVIGFYGTTQEDAAFEVTIGVVDVGSETAFYAEVWDPDDRNGMLERVRELRPLAATATSGRSPEVTLARYTRAYNARDVEGIRALCAPTFRLKDRRPVGWDEITGVDAWVALVESAFEVAPDVALRVERVVARSDEAVGMVVVFASEENGAEVRMGWVVAVDEEGRMSAGELFDPADPMLARFAEVAGTGDWDAWHAEHASRYHELFRVETFEQAVPALYARDLLMRDHRPVGTMGTMDYAAYFEQMRSISGILRLRHARLEVVESAGPLRLARGFVEADSAADGIPTEFETWYVSVLDDERRVRESHMFAAEAEARVWWEHRCGMQRSLDIYNRHDLRALEDLLHEEFAQEDRRPGSVAPTGRAGFIQTVADIIELTPDVGLDAVLLGVTGDRRAMRYSWSGHQAQGGGAMEVTFFTVSVIREGTTWRSFLFATAEEAIAALHDAELVEDRDHDAPSIAAMADAISARDLEALGRLIAEDFQQIDRRQLGNPPIEGREEWLGMFRSMFESDLEARVEAEMVAASPPWRVVRFIYRMDVPDGGGEAAVEFFSFGRTRDGLAVSSELYATREEAIGALERARALADGDAGSVLSPIAHMYAVVERAFNECRWDEYAEVLRDDYWWIDFRPGLRGESRTREEWVAHLRRIREGKDLSWRQTHLEERANGIVGLARVVQTGTYRGGAYEIPFVLINAMDADGRSYVAEIFADDDPEAFRRLDELGEHHGLNRAVQTAINQRDFDDLRRLIAEDFRQDDHRAVGAEPIATGDAFVSMVTNAVAAVPDLRLGMDVLAVTGDRHLTHQRWTGHAANSGGAMEVEMWGITEVVGGRVAATHVFASEEEARRRLLDAPEAPSGEHPVELLAREHMAAVRAGDPEALGRLLSDDYVLVSHQSGTREETHGRDAAVAARLEAVRAPGINGLRQTVEVLETRGPRLGITRADWQGEYHGGPFAVSFLAVSELDGEGRIRREETFDVEDLERARALLDERASTATAGDAGPAGVDNGKDPRAGRFAALFQARDWDGMRELFAPEWTQIDHRALRTAEYGREQGIAAFQEVVAMAPDVRVESENLWASPEVLADALRFTGTRGGGAFENRSMVLSVWRAGRIVASEVLADDTPREEARTRFEQLVAREQNLAVRHVRTRVATFAERDWDAMRAAFNTECTYDDRRGALGHELADGREGILAVHRDIARDPSALMHIDVLGVRGARWCSFRLVITGNGGGRTGPWEVVLVEYLHVDEEGRGLWAEVAEHTDAQAATSRLAELAAAGEAGTEHERDTWDQHAALVRRLEDALNHRDRAALVELFAPAFRQEDHRPFGAPALRNRDEYLHMLETLFATAPELRLKLDLVDVAGPRRALCFRWTGPSEDGGPVEVVFWSTSTVQDGKVVESVVHPSEEAALTDLRGPPGNVPAVERVYAGAVDAFNARDWDRYAELIGSRWSDHRPGVRHDIDASEQLLEVARNAGDGSGVQISYERLATRGRAGLCRDTYSGTYRGGAFEVAFLNVHLVGDEGRMVSGDIYALEQEGDAWAKLEELAADPGAPHAASAS